MNLTIEIYFDCSTATIPTFTYGIQIGWLSPMGPLLKSPESPASEPFSAADVTWMAAALPLGAICGIPFFSYASDRFGRKAAGVAVSVLSCVSKKCKVGNTLHFWPSISSPSFALGYLLCWSINQFLWSLILENIGPNLAVCVSHSSTPLRFYSPP